MNKLEARRLDAQQNFFDVELALGRHSSIIAELESELSREPYRERLWESYILGLYRSGRQADALAACRKAKRMFLDDLGIDPGPRLRSVEGLILRQDPSIAAPSLNGVPCASAAGQFARGADAAARACCGAGSPHESFAGPGDADAIISYREARGSLETDFSPGWAGGVIDRVLAGMPGATALPHAA